MSTVHNPSQFDPTQYEVVDYLDNKRPEYCGQPVELWREEIAQWKADLERVLGPDALRKSHRCVHCGNTNVRWITAVQHTSGDVVVFGADCTARLHFADKVSFKLALLKSRAEARTERFKIWTAREAYLAKHPEIANAIAHLDEPQHSKNTFVQDVIAKLDKFGYLSDRQAECIVSSMQKDNDRAAQRATEALEPKAPAPVGRVEVTGEVLSTKEQVSDFGVTLKMLLKLDTGARVWVTVPSKYDVNRGDTVTIRATFEVSKDDPSFAFGKRPTMLTHTPATVDEPAPLAEPGYVAVSHNIEGGKMAGIWDENEAVKTLATLADLETLELGERACEDKGDYISANLYRQAIAVKRQVVA